MTETNGLLGETVDANAGVLYDSNPGSQASIQQQASVMPQGTPQHNLDWFNNNWKSIVPQEYQDIVSKYNQFTDFLAGYQSQQSLIGRKVQDYARENWDAYSQMMKETTGIPADAKGYEYTPAEGSVLDNEEIEDLKNVACHLGLNQQQAEGLCDAVDYFSQMYLEGELNETVNSFAQLAQMWGNNAGNKLQSVKAAVTDILPRLLGVSSDQINTDTLGPVYKSPLLMELFAKIGELGTGSASAGYQNITPTNAAVTLEQMKMDPDTMNAMTNPFNPRHKAVTAQVRTLFRAKNGE